jgi:hypothetical protein
MHNAITLQQNKTHLKTNRSFQESRKKSVSPAYDHGCDGIWCRPFGVEIYFERFSTKVSPRWGFFIIGYEVFMVKHNNATPSGFNCVSLNIFYKNVTPSGFGFRFLEGFHKEIMAIL